MKSKWHVYILKCADGTLYTGITTDVKRRIIEHNQSPKAAKYTKARRPVMLAYKERTVSRSTALMREAALKKLRKFEKLKLIQKAKKKQVA